MQSLIHISCTDFRKFQVLGISPRRHSCARLTAITTPIFSNLHRNGVPAKSDLVWVAEFIYIRIAAGFCFLTAILDARSRKMVGHVISRRTDTQLALAVLNAAVQTRSPARCCIHHTDRGEVPAPATAR